MTAVATRAVSEAFLTAYIYCHVPREGRVVSNDWPGFEDGAGIVERIEAGASVQERDMREYVVESHGM